MSEILTKDFLKSGKFTVIERAQLEEVMKEQKLGLSGAVDSAKAAEIGKLAGAKLLVLGNVIQMGNSYQLTAKLVDAETSEMIASEITEVPVKTFDEDADRYLVLVPETESLGLYVGYSYWPLKTKSLPSVTPSFLGTTIQPVQKDGSFRVLIVGIRYAVAKNWVADLAVIPLNSRDATSKFKLGSETLSYTDSRDGGARVSIIKTSQLSSRWRAFYGVGGQSYAWTLGDKMEDTPVGKVAGNKRLTYPRKTIHAFSVLARGGLELRIKKRLGWSLGGQINQPQTVSYDITATDGTSSQDITIMKQELPMFLVESTFAFYF